MDVGSAQWKKLWFWSWGSGTQNDLNWTVSELETVSPVQEGEKKTHFLSWRKNEGRMWVELGGVTEQEPAINQMKLLLVADICEWTNQDLRSVLLPGIVRLGCFRDSLNSWLMPQSWVKGSSSKHFLSLNTSVLLMRLFSCSSIQPSIMMENSAACCSVTPSVFVKSWSEITECNLVVFYGHICWTPVLLSAEGLVLKPEIDECVCVLPCHDFLIESAKCCSFVLFCASGGKKQLPCQVPFVAAAMIAPDCPFTLALKLPQVNLEKQDES